MVKCPVCEKNFNSEFALNGHIRLTRDSEHITYWQQHSKKTSQTIASENLITNNIAGNSMIETLESFIRNQELFNEDKVKTDMVLIKIKDIIEEEREIEKEYQKLIDSEERFLEEERKKVREEVYQNYNQDVAVAVKNERDMIMKKWQQAVDEAYKKGEKKGYDKGCADATIYIPCSFCVNSIPVQPGSDLHRFLIELAHRALVGHPQCRMAYEQEQEEYYHQQELDRLISRLESKIMQ